MQALGLLRKGLLKRRIADLAFQELPQVAVRLLGIQDEGVLALLDQLRVVPVQRPVTGLDRQVLFGLCFAHADQNALIDARRIGQDQGRPGVGLGFRKRFHELVLVGAHGDAGDIDIAVGHHHLAHVLLGRFLAGSGELGDRAGGGRLGGLPAGVGVYLGIEDHHIDVLTRRHDMVDPSEADVVGRSVSQENPKGLLGEKLFQTLDLS